MGIPSGKGNGGCAPNAKTYAGGRAGTTPVTPREAVDTAGIQKLTNSQHGELT